MMQLLCKTNIINSVLWESLSIHECGPPLHPATCIDARIMHQALKEWRVAQAKWLDKEVAELEAMKAETIADGFDIVEEDQQHLDCMRECREMSVLESHSTAPMIRGPKATSRSN